MSYKTRDMSADRGSWPAIRALEPPDPRTPILISLDLDMTRAELTRVSEDLTRLQAEPNLDPHTRYVLTALTARVRTRSLI